VTLALGGLDRLAPLFRFGLWLFGLAVTAGFWMLIAWLIWHVALGR
jgi:hypothetical protein